MNKDLLLEGQAKGLVADEGQNTNMPISESEEVDNAPLLESETGYKTSAEKNKSYTPTLSKEPKPLKKKRWLIVRGLESLFSFSGRTSRIEFLAALPFLFMLASMSFLFIAGVKGDLWSMLLFYAVTALPAFLLQKTRIHDIGLPGWPSGLIALATPFVPLILMPQPSLANFPWRYALIGWLIFLAACPSFRKDSE